MSEYASTNDILIRVQETAREKGIRITFANMKVYLMLLEYSKECKDDIEIIDDIKSIRFEITSLELAKYCNSTNRIVLDSLRKLRDCGIIDYNTGFRSNNQQSPTVRLYKRYFE